MSKLIKWIAVLMLGLVVVVGLAIAYLLFALDPNDYKDDIEKLARDNGTELTIGGNLGWTFWPQIGISIEQVRFAQGQQASGSVDELVLALGVRELFQRSIAVRELRIEKADLTLADPGLLFGVAASPASDAKSPADNNTPDFALAIDAIAIHDSRIDYRPPDALPIVVEAINLETSKVRLEGQQFPLSLSFQTTLDGAPVALTLQSSLSVDLAKQQISSPETRLTIERGAGPDPATSAAPVSMKLSSGFDFDMGKLVLQLPKAQLELTQGTAGAQHELSGQLQLNADFSGQLISLSEMHLSADNIPLQGAITYNLASSIASGKIESQVFNLRKALGTQKIQLPEMSSATALTAVSLSAEFTVDPTSSTTVKSRINLDNQPLDIDLAIAHRSNSLALTLRGNSLRAADYMSQSKTAEPADNSALFAPLAAPLALWDGPSSVKLDLRDLQMPEYRIGNLRLAIKANQNILEVTELNADAFGGNIRAVARLDMQKAVPTLSVQPTVTNLDLGKALPVFAEFNDLTGLLSLNASLQMRGNDPEAIMRSLSGKGTFTVRNAAYLPLNLEQKFCEAAALVGSGAATQAWSQGTQLADLTGSFSATDGKVILENYQTATGNLQVSGKGSVRLPEQKYAMLITMLVQGSTTSEQGCSVNKRLRNQPIPFECQGSYAEGGSVGCRPDDKFLQDLVKGAVMDKITDKLLKQAPATETTEGETQTEQKPADPLESLIRGVFDKKRK